MAKPKFVEVAEAVIAKVEAEVVEIAQAVEAEVEKLGGDAVAAVEEEVKVKVRVLRDCLLGAVDDVVHVFESQVADFVAHGMADANHAAVAYAESLKGK